MPQMRYASQKTYHQGCNAMLQPQANPSSSIFTSILGAVTLFGALAATSPGLAQTNTEPFAFQKERYDLSGDRPVVCLDFNRPLDFARPKRPDDYIAISPNADISPRVQDQSLCLSGLDWGSRFQVTVRAGLPGAADGDAPASSLASDRIVLVDLPDAPPSVAFHGDGYVLAQDGDAVLPLATRNISSVDIQVLRIVDRNLIEQIRNTNLQEVMNGWSIEQISNWQGETVWSGTLEVEGTPNRTERTGIEIDTILDRSVPGIHIVTAWPSDAQPNDWDARATQWVLVSNLGISSFEGSADGAMTAFVHGLNDARPRSDITARLIARNNKILGEAVTDADGRIDFSAGLMRGNGGNTPTALMLYGMDQDFNLLRLSGPAFDLSDRGVSGRALPGPIDGFLWGDRDIYRPGETVALAGILRDGATASAVAEMPVALSILRPDGRAFRTFSLTARRAGSFEVNVELPKSAPTGQWTAQVRVDPTAEPVASRSFSVEDFVPERLALELSAVPTGSDTSPSLAPNQVVEIAADGRFLFGASAANLTLTSEIVVSVDPEPFPDWAAYNFGLENESYISSRKPLPESRTGAEGLGRIKASLPPIGDTTHPLRATIRATLLEPGGRGVTRSLDLQVRKSTTGDALALGLRPTFQDGQVAEGTNATAEVIALDQTGTPVAGRALGWALVREVRDYFWTTQNGVSNWDFTVHHEDVATGTIVTADQPVEISAPVDWGRYRIEIFDSETGAASSIAFSAGWRAQAGGGSAPDKVWVVTDRDSYRPGDTARVFIAPPYAGEALIAVLGDEVLQTQRLSIPEDGAEFSLVVGDNWGAAGAYVSVTLLRPTGTAEDGAKGTRSADRAIGISWLKLDREERKIAVVIDAPTEIEPNTTLTVPVQLTNLAAGQRGYLTLAAVDQGVLSLTTYQTPDPFAHYFGRRVLGVDIRDLYGRLIEGQWDRMGRLRAGGDAMAEASGGLDADAYDVVSLFSGIVETDAEGRAEITLEIPDFNGELRLMAVAFSADRIGSGEATLPVRPPLVAELSRPRFLAPGDQVDLTLDLTNLTAPAGVYTSTVTTDGPVAVIGDPARTVELASGGTAVRSLRLGAKDSTGVGTVSLTVAGPDGFSLTRRFEISVRDPQTRQTRTVAASLPAARKLVLNRDILGDLSATGATLAVTVGTGPTFNLPRLLDELARYPYGCLEQTISTSMPLLYIDDLAAFVGTEEPSAQIRDRVQASIWRLMNMQRYDGAFGLWTGYGEAEPWLTAYAVDFLGRARRAGYTVPDSAFDLALDWLESTQNLNTGQEVFGANLTYTLYLLAREGRRPASEARYLQDTHLAQLDAASRVQLAGALALSGETGRVSSLLRATDLQVREWDDSDYGSTVRDGALRLTRMIELGADPGRIGRLSDELASTVAGDRWLSTQEKAWLTLAAKAMIERQEAVWVAMGGQSRTASAKPVTAFPQVSTLTDGYMIENRGTKPVRISVAISGRADGPLPAIRNGFGIDRTLYTLDGTPVAPDAPLKRGTRYMVLLDGTTDSQDPQQAMVIDLLPAGLEIENTRLVAGGSLKDFGWLGQLTRTETTEFRDDRFVAAIDLNAERGQFRVAYLVRAVTPGDFVQPATQVEDMYRPERLARTALSRVTVAE